MMRSTQYWNSLLVRFSYLREHFTGVISGKRARLYKKILTGAKPAARIFARTSGLEARVFRGKALSWKAGEWSLNFFRKNYGSETCNLLTEYGLADFKHRELYRESTLQEVIREIKAKRKIYLRFSPLIEKRAELMAALDTGWLRNFRRWDSLSEAFHLFIGSAGTYTRLHAEMEVSVFVQLEGRKRWRFFPPLDYANLYPRFSGKTHFVTEFDAWPAPADFPLVERANMTEVILEPGDALYLPPFSWHYAENLDNSVGMAYRFNSPSLALRSAPFLTMMRLLAYNPGVFYTLYHALVTKRNPLFEGRR